MSTACSRQEKTQGALVSYEYSYGGAMYRSGTYYKVEQGQDGIVRVCYSNEGRWGAIKVYRGPADALEKIDRMIVDGKLKKLKNNYKTPFNVLDGWDWDLHIRYEQGSISSGGYMAKPPASMWSVIESINAYIDTLVVEENYLETLAEE